MSLRVKYYLLLFFVAAFLGWVMEVACKLIQFHRFINRGFLIGPYCPIYGFGAVLVTALLSRFTDSPVAVFVLAMALCGLLEYITSYLMEKLFHARWWDYSQKRFNLNGRVCADTLIPFGLLGLIMIYFIKPKLFGYFGRLPIPWLDALCIGLTALLLSDVIVSTCVLTHIRRNAESAAGDSTEAITQAVRATLAYQGALVRRTLRAFPSVRLYNKALLLRLRERRLAIRQELKQRHAQLRADMLNRDDQLRREIAERKHRRS